MPTMLSCDLANSLKNLSTCDVASGDTGWILTGSVKWNLRMDRR